MLAIIRWWEAVMASEVMEWQYKNRVDWYATDGRNCGAERTEWKDLIATLGVARLTLQTRKLWLVGFATHRDARHACLRFLYFCCFLSLFFSSCFFISFILFCFSSFFSFFFFWRRERPALDAGVSVSRDTNQPTNQSFRLCKVNLATLKVATNDLRFNCLL